MQDNDNRLFFIPKEALDPISGAEYIKKTIFEEIQEAKEKRHIEHVNQINSLRSKISELTEQLQNIEKKVILNTITISKGDEVSAIPGFNEFYEELKDKFAPITDDHSKLIDRYKKTSRSSKR
jgi:vacuolar-type H+-ATPase subunit I/STV1